VRVAVIGATGWLGRAVAGRAAAVAQTIEIPHTGLPDSNLFASLVGARPDTIINAAGMTVGTRDELMRANAEIVSVAISACRETGAQLLTLGSAAEYGPHPEADLLSEALDCAPISDYGLSKLRATQMIEDAVAEGISATTLRLFNPVGPGIKRGTALGDLAQRFRQSAHDGDVLTLVNHDVERDYVRVSDIAGIVINLIGRATPCVVNVGTGSGLVLGDIAAEMARMCEVPIEMGDLGSGRVRRAVADVRIISSLVRVPSPMRPEEIARMVLA
jgi:nucleoside-diphosphate-sugar epimerase